jgi:hypothetical protein
MWGVLQARHGLGLALEAPNEVGMVRELGWHRLDRDLSPDLRLGRPVDHAERSLADLLEDPVAAQGLTLGSQVRVLAQDPLVQRSELVRGVDPELVGQERAGALERRERLGLPVEAVQGEHQLAPEPFAERMRAGEGLELGHHARPGVRGGSAR